MYTPDVPVIGDSLGGTRDRIRTNFELIDSVFGQEHWTFGETDQGIHKRVVMPEATTSGSGIPGTNADAAALFVNPGTNPAEANLYIRGESNGKEYQLTTLNNANWGRFGKDSTTNPNGWTFLPGGLYLQWGFKVNPTSSGTVTLTDANFQFPTSMLMVFANFEGSIRAFYRTTVQSNNVFSYSTGDSVGAGTLKWMALGY